jgi:hypothetical protein
VAAAAEAVAVAMRPSTEVGRRRWGYVVWGLTGLAIVVPEIWAAKWPEHARFPTISGTVGYLEYWHDWVALLVVGVLVWAALHAIRFRTQAQYESSARHTDLGRYTLVDPKRPFVGAAAIAYYVVAIACCIGVPLIVVGWRPDDEYLLGEVMYGSIALFAFVLPGIAALVTGKDVPFTTLFATFQNIQERARPLAVLIAAGIVILLLHLAFYPWPSVIPELQDLNKQRNPSHEQLKKREPDPFAP